MCARRNRVREVKVPQTICCRWNIWVFRIKINTFFRIRITYSHFMHVRAPRIRTHKSYNSMLTFLDLIVFMFFFCFFPPFFSLSLPLFSYSDSDSLLQFLLTHTCTSNSLLFFIRWATRRIWSSGRKCAYSLQRPYVWVWASDHLQGINSMAKTKDLRQRCVANNATLISMWSVDERMEVVFGCAEKKKSLRMHIAHRTDTYVRVHIHTVKICSMHQVIIEWERRRRASEKTVENEREVKIWWKKRKAER